MKRRIFYVNGDGLQEIDRVLSTKSLMSANGKDITNIFRMKKSFKSIFIAGLVAIMVGLASCEEYLEREPESVLNPEVIFSNFVNFQGFTEELYHLVVEKSRSHWISDYNWGDDMVVSLSHTNRATNFVDRGDYFALLNNDAIFLDREWRTWIRPGEPNQNPTHVRAIWGPSWYGIRKANIGLANLHRLVDATEEEKNLIRGQLLFFRGFFHFQLIKFWGPLPFIDHVLPSDQPPRLARPATYQEVADLISRDFAEAAELLPFHWDNTVAGQRTLGFNRWRANKVMALSFMAKNYLYAASPLMNLQSTGSRTYHQEYAQKAAAAAARVINYVETGQTWHRLVPWANIADVFYTFGRDWLIPGSTEAIFQAPNYHAQSTNWHNSRVFAPQATIGRETPVYVPAANYVNFYGMANGLPLDHPASGFDPEFPWRGRDPRFYKDFVVDGERVVEGTMPPALEVHRFATLFTGGASRDPQTGSRTGYLVYKWIPVTANRFDLQWDQAGALTIAHSHIRLADVYLMYAEAAAMGFGSSSGRHPGFGLDATDAVNVIRDRAGVTRLATGLDIETFMSELRRERAVELSFEGHRWHDLRRWLRLSEYPYNIKTAHEFDRAPGHVNGDIQNNRVLNFREAVIIERNFTDRHYWLPLRVDDTSIYEGFHQNPGW